MRGFLTLALSWFLHGCSGDVSRAEVLQGYAEGEYALIAAPAAGRLDRLHVQRGQQVPEAAALFSLDAVSEQAAHREASERVRGAEERLANLRSGRRPAEVDAANAQAAQAAAARRLSAEQLRQQEKLFAGGFISKSALDQARANHDRDMARVQEAEAQGRIARQPLGREAELRAAEAEVESARAVLAQAAWRLSQRSATAPGPGLVQDTYFVEGEWVPAGRPVLSLLPAGNLKLRFFLPEQRLGTIRMGDRVMVACDGCGDPFPATVSYVSPQAEFTPPVIYSKETRARLVFMLEARPAPADAARLHPGQPVDVTLQGRPAQEAGSAAP